MYSLFIALLYISVSLSAKVTWLPNKSLNLPFNFKNGELPCSKQIVVFPGTLSSSIRVESGTSVGGFVLPEEGELIIDGEIELGPIEDDNCTAGNTYYTDKLISQWLQPDVWDSPRFNEATPDAERIPCFDDVVEFPNDVEFTVLLPNEPQSIHALIVNGINYDTSTLMDYVVTQSDQTQLFILNDHELTGIEISQFSYCKSPAGCSCQKNQVHIDCTAKFCPKPSCVDPVKPIGHCCKICGGAVAYFIDETFDMTLFKEQVEKTVESYGRDNLIYHVSRIDSNIVQLVVVDKREYTGISAEVVNEIAYNTEDRLHHDLQISGSPLYKSGLGGKLFISMFFTVILIMAGIYIFYYKVPDFRFPIIGGSYSTMFARFDRRTDSVVSLARRDSVRTIGPSEGTAFKNPLYDSDRKSVDESSLGD